MKLNIYILSHPIIQIFNKNIINSKKIKEKTDQSKITIFLLYEILRKIVKITNIYIYKMNYLQQFSVMDCEQKNYIVTDIVNNLNMLTEVSNTFPQTEIKHFSFNYENEWNLENFNNINDKTNIIILEKFLESNNILKLIKYFKEIKKIQEKQITITCITCSNQVLEKISQYYNDINIYTTHISYA
uniref:Uracil phosphoribosyltransferase n=1 Tax=Centroceras clavulatum TaxID=159503 RepID=A0A4D6WPH0_9FLOR|nr:Uracil phosphoribosyltransferase [Centroceras clavulatum]